MIVYVCNNNRERELVKGFTLTQTEIKELQRWLDFVHEDVEDALLVKFNIQGLDQLRSSQMEEVIDTIQDLHREISYGKKK